MMNKKNLKSLRNDKRAVSPVIGVILMVAITVILAAVIGAFVFGYGAPTAAPQVSLKLQHAVTADQVTVLHEGGDALSNAEIQWIESTDYGITWTAAADFDTAAGQWTVGGSNTFDTAGTTGDTLQVRVIHIPSQALVFDGSIAVTAT